MSIINEYIDFDKIEIKKPTLSSIKEGIKNAKAAYDKAKAFPDKLKEDMPEIKEQIKHYTKPRVKWWGDIEGLGDYYSEGYRSLNQREWRGVKDTAYDFVAWLKLYGYMLKTLGPYMPQLMKGMFRYNWMTSYMTAAHMMDRHKLGLRGNQLRYAQENFFSVVHNSVDVVKQILERDENLNPAWSKKAADLRAKTVMFDEMTPKNLMMGFPELDWIDIACCSICLPGEVDQLANAYYVDAAQRIGVAPDVCPFPTSEVGCAIVDDYPRVGSSFITSNMPCDGSMGVGAFMDRYLDGTPTYALSPPQRFLDPETNKYAVQDMKNCIKFIEDQYGVKWDWDHFWKKAEEYNETTQCMLDKWDVNCTPYPQVVGSALALQREYEFQAAACLDEFMTETDKKVTEMMLKGYEEDKAADRKDYKYRAIVWCCPAHYYTHFTTWAEQVWGIRTLVDMESMLSHHYYTIGDKEQALVEMAMSYERMMMRSHSNGGYINALDECWKMCEKFDANIVIMYDHVSCKNFGGLHGLFEDQARERGIHLIWVEHDLMDPRTVSRKAMRSAVNNYMSAVFQEEPLDPTYLDYSDEITW